VLTNLSVILCFVLRQKQVIIKNVIQMVILLQLMSLHYYITYFNRRIVMYKQDPFELIYKAANLVRISPLWNVVGSCTCNCHQCLNSCLHSNKAESYRHPYLRQAKTIYLLWIQEWNAQEPVFKISYWKN